MIRSSLCVFALMASLPAAAAEWFVSPNGSDSTGNGTLSAPFRTVSHVLRTTWPEIASPGDTVTLRGGTYNECDVRLRKPLTLRSYANEMAHIHCNISTPDSVTIQIDTAASGSRLSRLEVSGGMYYAIMLQTDWYNGGGENNSGPSNVILEDLKIHDTGRDGIKLTPKSNHVTIRRSEIWNTGIIYPPGTPLDNRNADGIDSVNVAFLVVEDNYIHDISTTGLYFKGGSSDVLVQRNRIENTGMGGILVGFDTSVDWFDHQANPQYYEAIRGTVRNNIVRNTVWEGIGLYSAKDAVIVNNTIINTAQEGHAALYFGVPVQDWDPAAGRPPSINPTLRNNLVIQHGGTCIEIRHWNEEELGFPTGLSGSPNTNYNAFWDTDGSCVFNDQRPGSPISWNGTFAQWKAYEGTDAQSMHTALSVDSSAHLMPGSPAIDAGTAVAQLVDDFDAQPRVGLVDIGADELDGPLPDAIFGASFE